MMNKFVIKDGVLLKYRGKADDNVIIPEDVVEIDGFAFEDCTNILSVTIPSSVVQIGPCAFRGCSRMRNVKISYGVMSIAWHAFRGCSSLESVEIPDSVHFVGNCAFAECIRLTSVTLPKGLAKIANYMFEGCINLENIIIPNNYRVIGECAFYKCSKITSVRIPDSITTIGNHAFEDCKGLCEVEIHKNMTNIGKGVFSGCDGIERFIVDDGNKKYHSAGNCLIETGAKKIIAGCKNSIIPDDGSVTEIDSYAFSRLLSLTKIVVGSKIISIGYEAFKNCAELSSVSLSEGLIKIGAAAFENCRKINSITIPTTVEEIGFYAYKNCENIILYGLREEIISKYDIYYFTRGCPVDAVPFKILKNSSDKKDCVLLWLNGVYRRNEDDEDIKAYIKKQKSAVIKYIAEFGTVENFERFISMIEKPNFKPEVINEIIELSEKNKDNIGIIDVIIAYKDRLLSEGILKEDIIIAKNKPETKKKSNKTAEVKEVSCMDDKDDESKTYETVIFGKYMQKNENELTDLPWRILDKKDGKMLLITERVIDHLQFFSRDDNDWETSDIRKWLNEEFANIAFSHNEKEKIAEVLPNERVFLLSVDEFEKYFKNSNDARAKYTDYSRQITRKDYGQKVKDVYAFWWLRTPNDSNPITEGVYLFHVLNSGAINPYERARYKDGVRPAIWIKCD